MFSLIITLISIALVAALALATLYYGGESFRAGQAKAEAAKLRNQGQQLLAAAELFYVQTGQWPDSIEQMVLSKHLSTAPVAQRVAIQDALAGQLSVAGRTWQMPVPRQPLFVFDGLGVEVCSTFNQASYGMKGILPKLQPAYSQQCFGPSLADLLVVVGRGRLAELLAATNEGVLVPENVSADPIPDATDTEAWTVAPGVQPSPGEPESPSEPENPPAEPAQMTLSPTASLDFGTVQVGASVTRGFTVAATGQALTGLQVSVAHPSVTIVNNSCGTAGAPGTLAVGASCSVELSFAPVLGDSLAGAVVLVTADQVEDQSLSLSATVAPPALGFSLDFSAGTYGVDAFHGSIGQAVVGSGTVARSGGSLVFTSSGPTNTSYVSFPSVAGTAMGTRDFVLSVSAVRKARNFSGSSYYSGQMVWVGAADPKRIGLWVKDTNAGEQVPTLTINGGFYHAFENLITLNTPVTYEVRRTNGVVELRVNGALAKLWTANSDSSASNRKLVGTSVAAATDYNTVSTVRIGNSPNADRMFSGTISAVTLSVTP